MYGPRSTGVHISYDISDRSLFTAIKSTPGIGSIALQQHALTRFRETIAQNINYSVTIYVTLPSSSPLASSTTAPASSCRSTPGNWRV